MARLLRFLRLEPRREAAAPAVDPEIERLRAERNARFASGLEVAEEAPDVQPFMRCAVCEADNGRFAQKCANCGALLDTPEQRAYNEALWQRMRAYNESVEKARPEVPASPSRIYGEQIARTVARTEYARLDWMPGRRPSPGARILAALPRPLRAAAVIGGLAEIAGTGIAAYGTHDGGWRLAFFASVAVVGAIFLPRRR